MRKFLGAAAIVGLGLSLGVPIHAIPSAHAAPLPLTLSAACGLLVTHTYYGGQQFVPFQCTNALITTVGLSDCNTNISTGSIANTFGTCLTGPFAGGPLYDCSYYSDPLDPDTNIATAVKGRPTANIIHYRGATRKVVPSAAPLAYPGLVAYADNERGTYTPLFPSVETYTFQNVPANQCLSMTVNWAGWFDGYYFSSNPSPWQNNPFEPYYSGINNANDYYHCDSAEQGVGAFFWDGTVATENQALSCILYLQVP